MSTWAHYRCKSHNEQNSYRLVIKRAQYCIWVHPLSRPSAGWLHLVFTVLRWFWAFRRNVEHRAAFRVTAPRVSKVHFLLTVFVPFFQNRVHAARKERPAHWTPEWLRICLCGCLSVVAIVEPVASFRNVLKWTTVTQSRTMWAAAYCVLFEQLRFPACYAESRKEREETTLQKQSQRICLSHVPLSFVFRSCNWKRFAYKLVEHRFARIQQKWWLKDKKKLLKL